MIVALVERRVKAMEEARSCEAHGVAEELEVEVYVGVNLHLSGVLAYRPHLAQHVVMQGAALRLGELTADAEVVLVVCCERALGVGQREVAQVGCSEHLYASLRPLVEAFEQRERERVLQAVVACLVVDGVAAVYAYVVVGVGVEVLRRFIRLIDAAIGVELCCVYDARYRHILGLHPHRVELCLRCAVVQTVSRFPAVDADTSRIVDFFCSHRLFACNLCVVGTSAERLLLVFVLVEVQALALSLTLRLLLFAQRLVLLLRLHSELAGCYLVVCHLHLLAEAEAVAMREEDMLI